MHHAEKNKNVIYRLGRSIFPVRTSHPVNNIYILRIFKTMDIDCGLWGKNEKKDVISKPCANTIITIIIIIIMPANKKT